MQTKLTPFLNRELCVTPNKSSDGMAVSRCHNVGEVNLRLLSCPHVRNKRQKLLDAARATSNPSFFGRRIEPICSEAIFHRRNSRRAQLAAQRVKQREACRSRRGCSQRRTNLSIDGHQRRHQTPFDLPTRASVGDLKAATQPVPRLRQESSRLQSSRVQDRHEAQNKHRSATGACCRRMRLPNSCRSVLGERRIPSRRKHLCIRRSW